MEDKLRELFPDETITLHQYRSFVNQPERIQISSQEDINDYDPTTLTSYFNFRVRLPRPALSVKSIQLARASLPNAVTNIPDTECVWWYYALPYVSAGTSFASATGILRDDTLDQVYVFDSLGIVYDTVTGAVIPDAKVYYDSGNFVIGGSNYLYNRLSASAGTVNVPCIENGDTDYYITYGSPQLGLPRMDYLRYVRLMPSYAQPELMDAFAGGFNRTFQDYDDLVSEVNNATIDDPLNGEPQNAGLGIFKFVPNQIAFSYQDRFNKIVFTGLDTTYSYLPAAADDPIWAAAALELQARDRANTRFDFSGAIQIVQPFWPYRDLNLRLGFTYATYPRGDNFINMIRPIPPFIGATPSLGNFTAYDHVAPGYADLVYSSCCHLYTDITGGSTVDSIANKALLASLPMNTPNLGVGFHSLPLNNPLTKIVEQIYEIYIELRTDTGAPFYLGNNAIVSLELILTY